MEMILLIGPQAVGKSTFYKQRFADSHVRINLDMLKTRHREAILVQACFHAKQPFVVDNTNPRLADRTRYIPDAKEARFSVVGYYFTTELAATLQRNAARAAPIPERAIARTHAGLEAPSLDEGFDALFEVRIDPQRPGEFLVQSYV